MTDSVYVAGAFEHPTREAPDTSTEQLHAEVARGALADAGLRKDSVDGFLTAGVPEYEQAFTAQMMADYLGLDVAFTDTTDVGGSSYLSHVGHAASALRELLVIGLIEVLELGDASSAGGKGEEYQQEQDRADRILHRSAPPSRGRRHSLPRCARLRQ